MKEFYFKGPRISRIFDGMKMRDVGGGVGSLDWAPCD